MMQMISLYAIPMLLLLIPLYGIRKKQPVYELFIEGASEGVHMALQILPYLMAMLTAVAVFRASGAFELLAKMLLPYTRPIPAPSQGPTKQPMPAELPSSPRVHLSSWLCLLSSKAFLLFTQQRFF